MSAALILPRVWAASRPINQPVSHLRRHRVAVAASGSQTTASPYAFYRKHTECLLRRYLYASLQVGRAPALLDNPVARGWASSRPVKSFEDAVIFVLDVDKCLGMLEPAQRQLIDRITLQEYTYEEAAKLTGQSTRAIGYKYPRAVDRLTEILLAADLLTLPARENCQADAARRRCRSH
jgi:DNA-directed RNA polymerase specialized sigma24 family protein